MNSKLFLLIIFAIIQTQCQDVQFIQDLEIDRHMGQWYLIASIPNKLFDNCQCAAIFQRLLDQDNIQQTNQCNVDGGNIDVTQTLIRVEEQNTGHWTYINNDNNTINDYWVIELDWDYQWTVLGQPNGEGYWIFARQKTLSDNLLDYLFYMAVESGFDISNLQFLEQQCSSYE